MNKLTKKPVIAAIAVAVALVVGLGTSIVYRHSSAYPPNAEMTAERSQHATTTTSSAGGHVPRDMQICRTGLGGLGGNTAEVRSPFTGSGVPRGDLTGGGLVRYANGRYAGLPTFGSARATYHGSKVKVSSFSGLKSFASSTSLSRWPRPSGGGTDSFQVATDIGAVVMTYTGISGRSFTGVTAVNGLVSYTTSTMANWTTATIANGATVTTDYAFATAGEIVAAGTNTGLDSDYNISAATVYWFAPGAHVMGTSTAGINLDEAVNVAFVGGYSSGTGASFSGQGTAPYAFQQGLTGPVDIQYLTIEDWVPPNNSGAINPSSSAHWDVDYDTIMDNGTLTTGSGNYGGGAYIGDYDVYEYNCIYNNGQLGVGGYDQNTSSKGSTDALLAFNEVSYNGRANFPNSLGVEAGIKMWAALDTVVQDNWVHTNYSLGVWFDTDNLGDLVANNYISYNWDNGLDFEISYNDDITGNMFLANGWGNGSTNAGGLPYGNGIYLNQAGGDGYVPSNYSGELLVENNTFTNNWNGIQVYDDSYRTCGQSTDGVCTLDHPSVYTLTTCKDDLTNSSTTPGAPLPAPSARPYDYFDYCQWKPQNITIEDNTFNFSASVIERTSAPLPSETLSKCADANYWCGYNSMFGSCNHAGNAASNSWAVCDAIMGHTASDGEPSFDNVWNDNTYTGTWRFQVYTQGTGHTCDRDIITHCFPTTVSFRGWQASPWDLDTGSTYSRAPVGE